MCSAHLANGRRVLPACVLMLIATGACSSRHVLGVVDLVADGGPPIDASSVPEDSGGRNEDALPSADAPVLEIGPAVPPCGAFVPGNDLAVCAATYLGGRGAEASPAVAVAPGGTVVMATNLEGTDLGPPARSLMGGGNAAVVRLRRDGREVLSVTRIGENVLDVDVDPGKGRIVLLVAPLGLVVLSPEADQVAWTQATTGTRVSVGHDGSIAVLDPAQSRVTVRDADGVLRGTIPLNVDPMAAADVAIHTSSNTVVVTGTVLAGATRQPFLHGYQYTGPVKWRNYAWKETDIQARTSTASTFGLRVAVGLDDKIYYLGESHGGNTVHARNPRNLAEPADIVSHDPFSFPYNTALHVLFVGRFRPRDGVLEQASYLLTREPAANNGDGRSVHGAAIAADESGRIIVGGDQQCCMEEQSKRTVRGMALATSDPDGFVLVLSGDFKQRHVWHTFSRGAPSRAVGVAMRQGVAAAVLVQDQASATRRPLITYEPLQPRPAGGPSDSFLSVWPAP